MADLNKKEQGVNNYGSILLPDIRKQVIRPPKPACRFRWCCTRGRRYWGRTGPAAKVFILRDRGRRWFGCGWGGAPASTDVVGCQRVGELHHRGGLRGSRGGGCWFWFWGTPCVRAPWVDSGRVETGNGSRRAYWLGRVCWLGCRAAEVKCRA